jgi:hypothetical protein
MVVVLPGVADENIFGSRVVHHGTKRLVDVGVDDRTERTTVWDNWLLMRRAS